MKHILVGTDFSKSADRALAYAEEVALRFSAKIELVYVHPPSGEDPAEAEIEEQLFTERSSSLVKLAANVGERGITTIAHAYRGPVVATLQEIIFSGECDLVVLGCQGEHFLPNNPWGSTTTALIEDTRLPILAVPSYAPVKYPKRFLLATDDAGVTRPRQLNPLLSLLATERTQLLLYHYLGATEATTPHREYARLLDGIEYRFYYQVDDHQPIGNAVIEFANLVAADLVAVTHRERYGLWLRNADSIAERVTWTSSVPVLILQESY
ncbi:MAG: universal stress protein, partial [Bacteroidota bacterium]